MTQSGRCYSGSVRYEISVAPVFNAQAYRRADLPNPVTREFCSECGTHLVTHAPGAAGLVIVKRGTLDEPAAFGNPQMAIFTCDLQPFHHIPENVQAFNGLPGR